MIIFKSNKGFMLRSDKPKENWTDNEDVFVVEDGTKLANKIIQAYPYYNFITDESDNLIDIEVLDKPIVEPEPTLEEEVEELKQLVADLASLQLGV